MSAIVELSLRGRVLHARAEGRLVNSRETAPMITRILIDASDQTGVYYDERGHPMQGSAIVREGSFRTELSLKHVPYS